MSKEEIAEFQNNLIKGLHRLWGIQHDMFRIDSAKDIKESAKECDCKVCHKPSNKCQIT